MAEFLKLNWGNLASVFGLVVSLGVLWVAQKGPRAAEEARSFAMLKSLVEELEGASTKIQEVGIFLRAQKWDAVQLRVQEVLGGCKLMLARWGDHLVEDCRNDLMKASNITRSVALVAVKSSVRQLTEAERLRTLNAQVRAAELISSVLGAAR